MKRVSLTKGGFSLVELLVAMAVTSILMLALFSLVGQSTTSYTRTQRAVNTLSQARAFLQFFDRELSTRLPNSPLVHERGAGISPSTSDKIAFVRTLPVEEQNSATPGDLATSMYYIAYTADLGSSVSPKLFRKTLDPLRTQENMLDNSSSPPMPVANPADDDPIVFNVLGFLASPKKYDGSGKLADWSSGDSEAPAAIELSVTFIDDSSAQRFRNPAAWESLATSPNDADRQLIRTFTRVLPLAR